MPWRTWERDIPLDQVWMVSLVRLAAQPSLCVERAASVPREDSWREGQHAQFISKCASLLWQDCCPRWVTWPLAPAKINHIGSQNTHFTLNISFEYHTRIE
jgi:hypothetical protein